MTWQVLREEAPTHIVYSGEGLHSVGEAGAEEQEASAVHLQGKDLFNVLEYFRRLGMTGDVRADWFKPSSLQ